MTEKIFQPLPKATFPGAHALRDHDKPVVFKGLASGWPAVREWSFSELAATAPDIQVRLVLGDREHGRTQFLNAPLRDYLQSLDGQGPLAGQQLYLKEFNLLEAMPRLKQDLKHADIFPHRVVKSLQSWIGTAGSRTGLHHDYLDNLAVQVIGRKRFYLVRPGVVEQLGAVASKYDSWAMLASARAQELLFRHEGHNDFFLAELEPGDVLHVPAHWWHEIENVTPGILFGGFYGKPLQVAARWSWVQSRDLLHQIGVIGRGNCTCHTTAL